MSSIFTLPHRPLDWGASPQDKTGDNMYGYYTAETTQRYIYGTRGITWDGRVFKYAHSLDTLYAGYGARNGASADVSTLINSNTTIAIVAGDRTTTVTVAATEGYAADGVVAKDELAGAFMVIGHGGATTTETRMIIGNDAVASGGGTTIVTAEWPWAIAHAAGFMELPLNPYRYLIKTSEVASVMGVPNISTTTGYNIWIQTWGPCWCVPGGNDTTPGDSANDRTVVFVGDGSVNGVTSITLENGYQVAGFIIDATEIGTGCMPLVMLQISV
ncbi:MAG: hypothetical protein JXA96_17345 [Sedimentisphaerales bacterium]|nr:hypothetical protein [Sedimentisphaerales bacterium]